MGKVSLKDLQQIIIICVDGKNSEISDDQREENQRIKEKLPHGGLNNCTGVLNVLV